MISLSHIAGGGSNVGRLVIDVRLEFLKEFISTWSVCIPDGLRAVMYNLLGSPNELVLYCGFKSCPDVLLADAGVWNARQDIEEVGKEIGPIP